MRNLTVALTLSLLSVPGSAHGGGPIAATNAERASGFADRADCEQALGGGLRDNAGTGDGSGLRGSVFNRAAGNLSRCELVAGEYLIAVYPRPSVAGAELDTSTH